MASLLAGVWSWARAGMLNTQQASSHSLSTVTVNVNQTRHLFPLSLGGAQSRGCAECVCVCVCVHVHGIDTPGVIEPTPSRPHLAALRKSSPGQAPGGLYHNQKWLKKFKPLALLALKMPLSFWDPCRRTAPHLTYPTPTLFLDAYFLPVQVRTSHIVTII